MRYQESQRDQAWNPWLSRTLRYTNDKTIGTQDAKYLSLCTAL
jgi:hypothetical protein